MAFSGLAKEAFSLSAKGAFAPRFMINHPDPSLSPEHRTTTFAKLQCFLFYWPTIVLSRILICYCQKSVKFCKVK
jgi:hypothetical protein